MPVSWIVVCCRARLEYEDAQVGASRRETARDDAASSATYKGACSLSEERGGVGGCDDDDDDTPPAMIISYSSLIVMGIDIVVCFCKVDVVEKSSQVRKCSRCV